MKRKIVLCRYGNFGGKVEDGLLQKTLKNGVMIYKGVSYEAPPVGDLRWRAISR